MPLLTPRFILSSLLCITAILTFAHANESPLPNRDRIGINLSGSTDGNPSFSFRNQLKTARPWQREDGSFVAELDSLGYPVQPDTRFVSIVLEGAHHPAGRYVLTWQGSGEFSLEGDVTRVVSTAPGRIEIEVTPQNGLRLVLNNLDPANPPREAALYLPGLEHGDHPFNPDFLAFIRSFGLIRFMNSQGTNGSTLATWADSPISEQYTFNRPKGAPDIRRGLPVSWLVEMCNLVKSDAYFCMPERADDDYIRRFATYVRDRLDPELKAYVEYSNEVWNSSFAATGYSENLGRQIQPEATGLDAVNLHYARRSKEIFAIWHEVFGDQSDRVVRVIGGWAARPDFNRDRLAAFDLGHHADALAVAPYFGFNPELLPAGLPRLETVEQALDAAEQEIKGRVLTRNRANKALADHYGLAYIAYEGGQHLVAPRGPGGQRDPRIAELFLAANRHPRMAELYHLYFNQWFAEGGGVMAHYSSIVTPGIFGTWGLKEHLYQPDSEAPKYRAILELLRDPALPRPAR